MTSPAPATSATLPAYATPSTYDNLPASPAPVLIGGCRVKIVMGLECSRVGETVEKFGAAPHVAVTYKVAGNYFAGWLPLPIWQVSPSAY